MRNPVTFEKRSLYWLIFSGGLAVLLAFAAGLVIGLQIDRHFRVFDSESAPAGTEAGVGVPIFPPPGWNTTGAEEHTEEGSDGVTSRMSPSRQNPERGQYAVQLGAFTQRGNAADLAQRLRQDGFEVTLHTVARERDSTIYQIWSRSVATRLEANMLSERLKRRNYDGFVVKLPTR